MRFGIARAGTTGDSTPPSPSTISSDEVREVGRQAMALCHQLEIEQAQLTDLERKIEGSSPRRSYADVVRGSPSIGSSTPNSKMSISSAYVTAEDGLSHDNLSSIDSQPDDASTEDITHQTIRDNFGSLATKRTTKKNRWKREESEEVYLCFILAKLHKYPITSGTYKLWRARNPSKFPHLTPVTLSNYRRYYERKMSTDEKRIVHKQAHTVLKEHTHLCNTISTQTNIHSNSQPYDTSSIDSDMSIDESHSLQSSDSSVQPRNYDFLTDTANNLYTLITNKFHSIRHDKIEDRYTPPKYKSLNYRDELEGANIAVSKIVIDLNLESINDLNTLQYATAHVLSTPRNNTKHTNTHKKPTRNPYSKLERSIFKKRQLIGRLTNAKQNRMGKKGLYKLKKITQDRSIQEQLQIERMKLSALCQKMKRMKAKKLRFINNNMFLNNQKKLFQRLQGIKLSKISNPPTQPDIDDFWTTTLSTPTQHNRSATWLKSEKLTRRDKPPDTWVDITTEDLQKNLKKLRNWKAPGLDKVQNFWIKKLHALHSPMVKALNHICHHPESMPLWMTEGTTTLIYKKGEESLPKNYRPITCLPTTFKLLTLLLSNKIYDHITRSSPSNAPILQLEQKGFRKQSRGCKDQLLIDKCIMKNNINTNINFAWIDYEKAYDSIPHSWIKEVLELYKIDPTTSNFIIQSMQTWKTKMHLHHKNGTVTTKTILIRRGIFQGDSLSPLLFCICLFPLTNMLNRTNIGVHISKRKQKRINHLLYMDDIKLFANGDRNMNRLMNLLKTFNTDVNMKLGIDKCAIFKSNKGKIEKDLLNLLPSLNPDSGYKYLGLIESSTFHQKNIKENAKKQYYKRLRNILKANLNGLNTSLAIKLFAVPTLRYSFGVIHWTDTELHQIDRKTRKILFQFKYHHPKSDVNNIYIPRSQGGRGIPCIYDIHSIEISNIAHYLSSSNDIFLNEVKYYEACATPFKSILRFQKNGPKYKTQLKCDEEHKLLRNNKTIYGKFFKSQQDTPTINLIKSNSWLKKSYLRFETESVICAAQEQALMTNWKKHMCNIPTPTSKCRLCKKFDETIMHVASGCKMLANNLYLNRHNKVATYIHWCVLQDLKQNVPNKWYLHKPERSMDVDNITIMWDFTIITDTKVPHNKPDIIIHDRINHKCLIVEVSIPQDINILQKYAEKIRNYRPLEIELTKCWNLNQIETVPIILGALGSVSDDTLSNLDYISRRINFNIVQKTVLIGTQSILKNVLTSKHTQT